MRKSLNIAGVVVVLLVLYVLSSGPVVAMFFYYGLAENNLAMQSLAMFYEPLEPSCCTLAHCWRLRSS